MGNNLKIGLTSLISAYEAGSGNLYEMAKYLNATEEYLKEAIDCYKCLIKEYITQYNKERSFHYAITQRTDLYNR